MGPIPLSGPPENLLHSPGEEFVGTGPPFDLKLNLVFTADKILCTAKQQLLWSTGCLTSRV